jgi:hypothetical protein
VGYLVGDWVVAVMGGAGGGGGAGSPLGLWRGLDAARLSRP